MLGFFEDQQAGQNRCSDVNKGVSSEDETELVLGVAEVCVGLCRAE